MNSLKQLMNSHPMIGDVRGVGLFIGIDLVRSRETREPATEEAQHIIARMKEEYILLSADGPYRNVLKIKPPLVLDEGSADRITAVLDKVLTEIEGSGLFENEEKAKTNLTTTATKKLEIEPLINGNVTEENTIKLIA